MSPRRCSRVLRRGALLAACALLSVPAAAAGQPSEPPTSTSYPTRPAEFSLAVSPTRLEVDRPGTATTREMLVVNRGEAPLDIVAEKRDFTGGRDGSLVFRDSVPYSASSWVGLSPTRFHLEPGIGRTVTVRIVVPPDPEPGDHQVALVFLVPATAANDANVRINRAVATPVYVTVPGPVDDSANVTGLEAPGFVMSGPVELTAQVRSTGTVHRDFRGTGRLTADAAGSPVSFPDFTVARGATRDVATTWEPPWLCVCHPTISLTAADGTVHTASVAVVVFPVHWLIVLVAVVLLVFFVVRRGRRRAGEARPHA